MEDERSGWRGTLGEFLQANKESFLSQLYARYPSATLQEAAWASTFDHLKGALQSYLERNAGARGWRIIFEYQMPRARDRPIDVCILTDSEVLVIEVKDTQSISRAAVDQLQGYLRDLHEYHHASRTRSVRGMILVTRASRTRRIDGNLVGNADALSKLLDSCKGGPISSDEVQSWMHSPYHPLPDLIEAAVRVFEEEPLPQIRTIEEAALDATVDYVLATANRALQDAENHLILLTGVPGSGKTLVGLQSTYQFTRDHQNNPRGLFLSGNGPLIEVLQYQLESGILVQNIHEFISEYAPTDTVPDEHLYVFDEAQRAWDQDHVVRTNKKKKRSLPPESEPAMLLNILGRRPEGSCLVAIIGEGQSIYKGEQRGFDLWADALQDTASKWAIHASPQASTPLTELAPQVEDSLHLAKTVRAHRATKLHRWIEAVLDQRVGDAAELAANLKESGFWLRLTRNLEEAKNHLENAYDGRGSKTYGMVGSSKANNLGEYGVDLSFVGAHWLRPGQVGPWYVDREGEPAKCRELVRAAQEFQCQGLELDGTLVLWGRDLSIQDGDWVSRTKQVPGIQDPHALRLNAYRILLSRARDGMVIFVTPEEELDETAAHLRECGVEQLHA